MHACACTMRQSCSCSRHAPSLLRLLQRWQLRKRCRLLRVAAAAAASAPTAAAALPLQGAAAAAAAVFPPALRRQRAGHEVTKVHCTLATHCGTHHTAAQAAQHNTQFSSQRCRDCLLPCQHARVQWRTSGEESLAGMSMQACRFVAAQHARPHQSWAAAARVRRPAATAQLLLLLVLALAGRLSGRPCCCCLWPWCSLLQGLRLQKAGRRACKVTARRCTTLGLR